MLSLYEILKASKTGIAPDMWTALAGMNWGGKDSGTEVKELTGIPPLSIRSNGTMLLDYLISGNMSRSGTPSPDNPIQPQECGELETVGEKAGQFKIPISSAGQTTPVYLGEVQTVRQIKKLVLTGNEKWYSSGAYTGAVYAYHSQFPGIKPLTPIFCTHLVDAYNSSYVQGTCTNDSNSISMWVFDTTTSPTAFNAYLAAQYAAGTPVTVWYVLATPTTGIVNEPLRKIGEYADTLSMEQAGVQIPTLHGNTVIDVETTLKPSEMYIKYQE